MALPVLSKQAWVLNVSPMNWLPGCVGMMAVATGCAIALADSTDAVSKAAQRRGRTSNAMEIAPKKFNVITVFQLLVSFPPLGD